MPCLAEPWTAAEEEPGHVEIRLAASVTCHPSVARSHYHRLCLPARYAWRPCEYHVWDAGDEDQTGRSRQNRSRPGVKRPVDGPVLQMVEGHQQRQSRQILLER